MLTSFHVSVKVENCLRYCLSFSFIISPDFDNFSGTLNFFFKSNSLLKSNQYLVRPRDNTTCTQFSNPQPHEFTINVSLDIPCSLCPVVAMLQLTGTCDVSPRLFLLVWSVFLHCAMKAGNLHIVAATLSGFNWNVLLVPFDNLG